MINRRATFYLKRAETRDSGMDSCLELLTQTLDSAVDGMSAEQMTWHPAGKWCAAEILEHLYLTYTGTVKGFERVKQAGKPLVTPPSTKHRWRTFVLFGVNYFPEGRSAPKQTAPRGLPLEKVRSEVTSQIAAMDALIGECEARLGSGRLLDHPVLGPLSAAQWKRFHLIHGQHHAEQIARLRQQMR
jgi:hypothetical protein